MNENVVTSLAKNKLVLSIHPCVHRTSFNEDPTIKSSYVPKIYTLHYAQTLR